jgi:hypothetical protein
MKKETKDMLLADGNWFSIGLVIGAFLGGLFVLSAFHLI